MDASSGQPPPPPKAPPSFTELLSCSITTFMVLAPNGEVLYMSPSVSRVFAVEPEEFVGCAAAARAQASGAR